MQFHNRLLDVNQPLETVARIPFHALNMGDRYKHLMNGNISEVVEKKEEYIMIRRHDDWLIHCKAGSFIWDKMVIKVTPLRK
jgi:hypothetical protein